MFDDEVYAGRFRYPLALFGLRVLIGLSRLLHGRIANEIAIAKITEEIWRISHWLALFDTVEFNRLQCPSATMYGEEVLVDRFRDQLTMFGIDLLIWLSRLLHAHISYEKVILKNHYWLLT